jgi:hypothetical protein
MPPTIDTDAGSVWPVGESYVNCALAEASGNAAAIAATTKDLRIIDFLVERGTKAFPERIAGPHNTGKYCATNQVTSGGCDLPQMVA